MSKSDLAPLLVAEIAFAVCAPLALLLLAPSDVALPKIEDDMAAAVFGLVGVVLGAFVSAVAQFWFQQRLERDRKLADAYSLVVRVKRIANTVVQMARHITAAGNVQGQIWLAMAPFRSFTQPEHFTASELAIFYASRDAAFADELSDLESLHNLMVTTMAEYSDRKEALDRIIESTGEVEIDGEDAIFNSNVVAKHGLQIAKLKSLALHLQRFAREGEPHALKLLLALGGRLRKHLNDGRFDLQMHAQVSK